MKIRSIECPSCGAPIVGGKDKTVLVCEYCGKEIWLEGKAAGTKPAARAEHPSIEAPVEYSPCSHTNTLVLALLFGVFGGHRFYTGHVASGVIQLFTGGGMYIWWLIDIFSILSGSFRDSQGRPLNHQGQPNRLLIGFAVYAISVVFLTIANGQNAPAWVFFAALIPALTAANWDKIQKRLSSK